MPLITIQLTPESNEVLPDTKFLDVQVPADRVEDLWSFFTCLATKTDVLIPAVLAIVDCARGSAPPRR